MPVLRPLPEPFRDAPFSVRAALAAGIPPGRLRRSDLDAPHRGVRVPASVADEDRGRRDDAHRALCRALAPLLRPGDLYADVSAALLWHLPVPRRLITATIDIASPAPRNRMRRVGVRGVRLRGHARIGVIEGMPVMDAVDTWCRLAHRLTLREVVVMGDALMRRRSPLATPERLAAAVAAHAGRPGASVLRAALSLVRPRTDSVPETEWRLDVVAAGLPEPEVNGAIVDAGGDFVAFGDLVFREYRVVTEYDGEQHRTDAVQFARDIRRLDDIMHLGWRVVRVTKEHRGAARAERIARIRDALVAGGWRPE